MKCGCMHDHDHDDDFESERCGLHYAKPKGEPTREERNGQLLLGANYSISTSIKLPKSVAPTKRIMDADLAVVGLPSASQLNKTDLASGLARFSLRRTAARNLLLAPLYRLRLLRRLRRLRRLHRLRRLLRRRCLHRRRRLRSSSTIPSTIIPSTIIPSTVLSTVASAAPSAAAGTAAADTGRSTRPCRAQAHPSSSAQALSIHDFSMRGTLGEGAFGR